MRKIVVLLISLIGLCFCIGTIVSLLENKKGWVEEHIPKGFYEKYMKRSLDFGVSLFALIMFWPILTLIAIAVRVQMGSPIVFTQDRPGLGGRVFKIKKFRTMTNEKDSEGNLLPDDQRLTKFGRFLRASSADETLELFAVLRGDMAIVGPRPLLVAYLDRYTEEQMHRHDVRPGITGYAQTEGRNLCSWEEKFSKDVEYVNNITFIGDLKIILKTILVVVKREGITSNTSSTMEAFTGNESK